MHETNTTTDASPATTGQTTYRIYDRTGGGVTHDIFAETLEDAIEQGRDWIEEGDWSGRAGEGGVYHIGIPLDCGVREIVRVPDLRSIESLPDVGEASVMPDGTVRVECGPETPLDMLPGRVIDGASSDEDGWHAVILADVTVPTMIDEEATLSGDAHDCSGEYSDTLPDCEMAEHASADDTTDDEGHVWRQPYSVVGGIEANPGEWGGNGTNSRSLYVCRLCGCYRNESRAGSQRNPDEPREIVTIKDKDEDSEAWLKRTHEEDGFLPTWLAEMLDCSLSTRMAKEDAEEFVRSNGDDSTLDDDDLEHAFGAIYGRRADDAERAEGLWSHLCAAVGKE